ncbi:MAG: HIT family protein [Desulfuromonas sp.]|nr:MAG: HIT family protein [Desulfuromonas sp.]
MAECPFCCLNDQDVICSNEHALAIYDAFPASPGHVLIVPRRHLMTTVQASQDELVALFALVPTVQKLLRKCHQIDAFTIGINDGAAAGQTVPHLHLHVIPRYTGDVADPRGGIRWVLPERADYWSRT